eukprot:scaffold19_cov114-Cylindrotheca_fusiformis.AAC.4
MKVSDSQEDQQQSLRDEALDRCSAVRNHRISFGNAVDPDAERVNTIDNRDILFGRGKGFQNREGNKRMRKIIDKYKEEYHLLNRRHKRNLVEEVHREIIDGGARFLTKLATTTGDCFVLVDGEVALQKVNNGLRRKKHTSKTSAVESVGAKNSTGSLVSTPARAETAGTTDLSSGRTTVSVLNELLSEMTSRRTDYYRFTGSNGYLPSAATMPLQRGSQPTLPIFNYYSGLQRDLMHRETMILQQRFDDARRIEAATNHSRNIMLSRVSHATSPVGLSHLVSLERGGYMNPYGSPAWLDGGSVQKEH